MLTKIKILEDIDQNRDSLTILTKIEKTNKSFPKI